MKSRVLARTAGLAVAAVILVAAWGCSKKGSTGLLVPNQRPSVTITSAPVDTRDTAFYAYRVNWSGDDPDGRVDHFIYAIDPGDEDTTWLTTDKNEQTIFFRSTNPIPVGRPGDPTRSINAHTFVIKAVDNLGLTSVAKSRAFFSYTVAPTVYIVSPQPSAVLLRQLTPSVRISWAGIDPDGQFTQKPIKYKYKLFPRGNSEFDYNIIRTKPDSLRRFYAKTNFASWDSVGGDTTSVQFTGLSPNTQYIFAVIGYDEAGAYSPTFSLSGNLLQFEVGFAGTLGPIISAYNSAFYYRMVSGGFTPNDPVTWVHLELPAANRVTFNWAGEPPPGADMQWFRWRLDGDVFDETPRTNETNDWYHWSAKSVGTTSCTIGPFAPNDQTFLYIEAMDNNGLLSLLTIVLHPIQPTFGKPLLIVDDTRLDVDQWSGGRVMAYTTPWPSAAELDTFLYAKGGYPWRGTQVAPTASPQPVSTPGLFNGYQYDTLGTRLGLQIASSGVPLSKLGDYEHVIWMVDHYGAINVLSPIDAVRPMSTMLYMCTPNHMNTLGSYISAGGSVWMVGGGSAYASLIKFDAVGTKENNRSYPGAARTIFSNTAGELVPGRLMYDGARWQNEMACQVVSVAAHSIIKSPRIPTQPWTSPGWNYERPLVSPNYANVPATMRLKALARGDSLPPTRTLMSQWISSTGTFDVEYMTQSNYIIEDKDPDVLNVVEFSALDTIMDARGSSLANTGNEPVSMTWYHGVLMPDFVFSGFNFWMWTRADDKQLVDFVLRDIWHLTSTGPSSGPRAAIRPALQSPANARPGAIRTGAAARLPNARSAER